MHHDIVVRIFAASRIAKQCIFSPPVCYSWNIPDSSLNLDFGDIYLQVSSDDSYSWIGLGTGDSMAESNMFIIYTDGKGNLTLSPRTSIGYFEPSFNSSIQATLLEGSGVLSNSWTANIKCGNCRISQTSWIFAALQGDSIDETDRSTNLKQHNPDGHASTTFNLLEAVGGENSNPFLNQSSSQSSTASSTATSAPSSTTSSTPASTSSSLSQTSEICVGLFFSWRKKQKARNSATGQTGKEWGKSELDGRAVPRVELLGERDAIEVPATPIAPVELLADTHYETKKHSKSAAVSPR
ncbi:CBD9-like protein [Lophium mytilinum]|uniref:CBD9-like protein n=1 Tax=Lophium mytilinum TaxID=390894 RepID=A0A6A6QCQ0_9PEZI|nr:CBD9-like protein [Lophium mytilinum]